MGWFEDFAILFLIYTVEV